MKYYKLPEMLYHQLLAHLGNEKSRDTGILYALLEQTKNGGVIEEEEKTPAAKES